MTTNETFDIDKLIEKYFLPANDSLAEPMRYALGSGGKRLRPRLLLTTAEKLGVLDENTERLAVAIECIHTYSLIHDDLPCMDNDMFRRGKPSVHAAFGETAAVLAGDGLLNAAAEIALSGKYSQNYFAAVARLFECSGTRGMICGQVADLAGATTTEGLVHIAVHKTGKMIAAALTCPSIYAGASEQTVNLLEKIGEKFGIAYQIADDLLDSDKEETSFAALLGKEECAKMLSEVTEEIISMTEKLPFSANYIKEAVLANVSRRV